MNIINKVNNYINDNKYQIIIKSDQVDIINYQEIIDFNQHQVTILGENHIFIIAGNNLVISEMQDDEILITGIVNNVRIN